jgi:hypothetical protein
MREETSMGPGRGDVPWDVSALVGTGGAMLIGLALVVTGWVGASGEVVIDDQFAWLNFAVAGVVLAGVAGALWIMQGRRAVGRRMHVLLAPRPADDVPAFPGAESRAGRDDAFVAAAAMTRYHLPSCLLARGKPLHATGPGSFHRREGRRPCELCLPDTTEAAS